MVKAIIFDFDGLIVDTETLWYEVFREVMSTYDVQLTLDEYADNIGTSDEILFKRLDQLATIPLNHTEIRRQTSDLYDQSIHKLFLREGVLDYLQSAKSLGLKTAIASSSSREWVEGFLKRFDIFHYFDVIKTSDDVKRVKPDPELYIQALRSLGTKANETICFEDSKNGLQAALQAGLSCILVPNSVTTALEFKGHTLRLTSMSELGLEEVINQIK